jgi:hypothetical protein
MSGDGGEEYIDKQNNQSKVGRKTKQRGVAAKPNGKTKIEGREIERKHPIPINTEILYIHIVSVWRAKTVGKWRQQSFY